MSLLLVLAISRKELYILNRTCYEFVFLCIQLVNLPERETSLHISFAGRIIAKGPIVDFSTPWYQSIIAICSHEDPMFLIKSIERTYIHVWMWML